MSVHRGFRAKTDPYDIPDKVKLMPWKIATSERIFMRTVKQVKRIVKRWEHLFSQNLFEKCV